MKMFNAAVIGCGGISRMHINALMQMANVKIVAVCDIKEDKAAAAAEKTGAKAYADWHEVVALKEVDTLHICLPHYLHAPVAIEALKNGKSVLSEKPMAISLDDARAMIKAGDESKGHLGIIFQNRYNTAVVMAKEIIASGEMGAFLGSNASVCWLREGAYYTASGWRGSKKTEGCGSLINQSIHTLDLLSYLGGELVKVRGSVATWLNEKDIEVEDNAMAVALYKNGGRCVIHTSNNNAVDAPVDIDLYMEKGTLKLYGPKLFKVVGEELTELCSGDNKASAGKTVWGTGHAIQIADYYASIEKDEDPVIDGRSAFAALSLVLSIVKSSEENRWIDIEKV